MNEIAQLTLELNKLTDSDLLELIKIKENGLKKAVEITRQQKSFEFIDDIFRIGGMKLTDEKLAAMLVDNYPELKKAYILADIAENILESRKSDNK